jgi:ATP/ADP translocase
LPQSLQQDRAALPMLLLQVLGRSLEIRCLAVMSLAQGLCNSLMEFAWKCHMRLLYPSPADFTAFLGRQESLYMLFCLFTTLLLAMCNVLRGV